MLKRARGIANRLSLGIAAFALVGAVQPAKPAQFDPVAFFTGSTRGHGALRELVGKAKRTQTVSVGHVDQDGWLILDQKVSIEGDPVRQRRWRLRQTTPGKFSGSLSDARGPVEAEVTGQSVHIRYKMKGGIRVEQTLTPVAGRRAVENRATFHKWGVKVATLTERIEKR